MQLGKYEIREELGKGGFGVVYKAYDLTLEREVALKILHPQLTVDARFIQNFKNEARSLAKINHPNVVSVYEIGEIEGRLFIAMRYLPGGSLAEKINREGKISRDAAIKIINEICVGLEAGHKRGIIHRDVKPGNILFDEEGQAVIGDFGVARAVQLSSVGTATDSAGGVGTPYYRPPELWRGKPTPSAATDVYSLACVLFEMLTGKILFQGDTPDQLITRHLLEDASNLIDECNTPIPPDIRSVIEKSLEKDPANRYDDVHEFQVALSAEQPTLRLAEAKPSDVNEPHETKGTGQQLGSLTTSRGVNKEQETSKGSNLKKTETEESEKPSKRNIPLWLFLATIGIMGIVLLIVTLAQKPKPTNIPATETAASIQLASSANPDHGLVTSTMTSTPEQIATPTLTLTNTVTQTISPSPTLTLTPSPTPTITLTPLPQGYFLMPDFATISVKEMLNFLDENKLDYKLNVVEDTKGGNILEQEPEAGTLVNDQTRIEIKMTGIKRGYFNSNSNSNSSDQISVEIGEIYFIKLIPNCYLFESSPYVNIYGGISFNTTSNPTSGCSYVSVTLFL